MSSRFELKAHLINALDRSASEERSGIAFCHAFLLTELFTAAQEEHVKCFLGL